jgi:hypothetical protein
MEFRIFPFAKAFATIRTHVLMDEPLSPDAASAQRQIFAAIRGCRLYVAQEHWQPATGFLFRVHDGLSTAYAGDDIVRADRPLYAEVRLPAPGRITVVQDGQPVKTIVNRHAQCEIDRPGTVRVEVCRKVRGRYRPWIYSNPVWVRERTTV